ncbi:hypothetical protein ACRAWG_30755 [Methylobacterium sp. P31]
MRAQQDEERRTGLPTTMAGQLSKVELVAEERQRADEALINMRVSA